MLAMCYNKTFVRETKFCWHNIFLLQSGHSPTFLRRPKTRHRSHLCSKFDWDAIKSIDKPCVMKRCRYQLCCSLWNTNQIQVPSSRLSEQLCTKSNSCQCDYVHFKFCPWKWMSASKFLKVLTNCDIWYVNPINEISTIDLAVCI